VILYLCAVFPAMLMVVILLGYIDAYLCCLLWVC
jgi:hypothetical protein